MSKQFKVATYNCASLRARMPLLLSWLQANRPDVVCLQETKVVDADFPADPIREAGYSVVFKGQKSYAGVAIVSLEEAQDVGWGLDDGGEPDDARLIHATIQGIPIVNTYVPQGRSVDSEEFQYKLRWLARIKEWFARNYSAAQPLLWVGDFNVAPEPIDVHDPKRLVTHADFHPEARAALEKVREWGFVDVFRRYHAGEPGQYTFWDFRVRGAFERGLGWRVDHIWATTALADQSTASWIDVDARKAERPSDHTLLIAEFAL